MSHKAVEEYLAAQPQPARRVLESIRSKILKAVPDVEEVISYGIPTFKLNGKVILHYAGWKSYVSLYPANERVRTEFKDDIAPYLAEKSTLRFPVDRPLPDKLIERIAKFRAAELA